MFLFADVAEYEENLPALGTMIQVKKLFSKPYYILFKKMKEIKLLKDMYVFNILHSVGVCSSLVRSCGYNAFGR